MISHDFTSALAGLRFRIFIIMSAGAYLITPALFYIQPNALGSELRALGPAVPFFTGNGTWTREISQGGKCGSPHRLADCLIGSFLEQRQAARAENFPKMITIFYQIRHQYMLPHEKKNRHCNRVESHCDNGFQDAGHHAIHIF
jgi:hypothetical protein